MKSPNGVWADTLRIPFRIRRVYYDQIAAGIKDCEVRGDKPYWAKWAQKAQICLDAGGKVEGVFINGKNVMVKEIVAVSWHSTAAEALGREPSEQGWLDIGNGATYKFHLKMERQS